MDIVLIGYGKVGKLVFNELKKRNLDNEITCIKSRKEKIEITDQTKLIIDCTASKKIAKEYNAWILAGKIIVTANKYPITQLSYNYIRECIVNSKLYINATVCTSLPLFETIDQWHKNGEKIKEIKAVVSSSLASISIEMAKGKSFDDAVVLSIKKGLTEPDYKRDLLGSDVITKAIILGRYLEINSHEATLCFKKISIKDLVEKLAASLKLVITINDEKKISIGYSAISIGYGAILLSNSGKEIILSNKYGGPIQAAKGVMQDIDKIKCFKTLNGN